MRVVPSRALVALLALFFTGSAWADEKVLVLKNGRKMQGEIEEETSSTYVIRMSGGGKATIPRAQVERIEDAPPPDKTPRPTPQPTSPETAPVDAPPVKKDKPTDEQRATPLPKGPGASGPSGERIGRAEDIEKAKKALLALPAIDPKDQAYSEDRRKEALEALVKETPLDALVGIIVEVGPYPPPPDRAVALDLVVAAGERARPLLARALLACDVRRGLPYELFSAVGKVGDDDKGTVENAIMARVREYLRRKEAPNIFTNTLGLVGSVRLLPDLYRCLLKPDEYHTNTGVYYPCQAILARCEDPDKELEPLAAKLDARKILEPHTLAYAIKIFEASKGAYVEKLEDLHSGLEFYVAPPDMDPGRAAADMKACYVATYESLAKIGTKEATTTLLKILDGTFKEDRRVLIYAAFAKLKRPPSGPTTELLTALVDHIEKSNAVESSVLLKTLQTLTGQQYGSSVKGWRGYIAALEKSPK